MPPPAAIQFGGCEDYALTEADRTTYAAAAALIECGRLEVPVDHENPGGVTAQIAVLRVPATGGEPIGSLGLNPGGSGQSGTQFAGLLTLILAQANSPLLQNFDIVGFDPRGVGATTPAVDCFTDQQRDEDEDLTMPTLLPDAGAWTEESAAAFAQQCAAGSGGEEVLAHLGTRDVARDVDLLREVLGDEELTYLGYSYGTRLGTVNGLYSAVNWPTVVAGVAEVRDGRGDGLLALRDTFATREPSGRYGNFLGQPVREPAGGLDPRLPLRRRGR